MTSTKSTHNIIRGLAFSAMMLLLLSVIVSSQNNTFINTVYADHNHDDNNNNKVKNKSLISDISDQVINTHSDKEGIQNILQLIQIQIAQTSGQDKATKTINLINSIINLNPNGPLAQSLLYLSKQQAIGNINSVNEAVVQVAIHVANGSEDIGQIINQAVSHTQQVISSSQSSSSSSSLLSSSSSSSPPSSLLSSQRSSSPLPSILPSSSQASQLLAANNSPPIADAGHSRPDQTVNAGSLVTLDGSASRDPNGDPITFAWTQLSGPPVQLSKPNAAKTSFTAPSNSPSGSEQAGSEVVFKLTVTDSGGLSDSDTASILVKPTATTPPPPPSPPPSPPPQANNSPPIADAGHSRPDQTVNAGSLVTLDGSASRDPNGDPITFAWTQLSGPPVQLSKPNEAKTSFTAPSNSPSGSEQAGSEVVFKLTVTDSGGLSDSDTASILVKPTATTPSSLSQDNIIRGKSEQNNIMVGKSAPPPSGSGKDKFGIKELYQSKLGGEQWFMNMDTAKDSRSNPPNLTKNADGSFRVSGQENIRYNIYTSTGYKTPSDTNQKNMAARGYMLAPNDWKNVEMTGYIRVVQNEPSDNHFTWYARGGYPTSTRNCEGTSIQGRVFVDGQTNFAKEQWHTGGYILTPPKSSIVGSIVGKWIGFKMVTYNFQENGKTVVMMQNWIDKDNNGNWVKVYEYIDRGGLGNQGGHCEAANQDQIITWGGPIATFRWDNFNTVDVKNLSIREIQPSQ